jgi:DNA (cytosine-5)-methyltransferase 1
MALRCTTNQAKQPTATVGQLPFSTFDEDGYVPTPTFTHQVESGKAYLELTAARVPDGHIANFAFDFGRGDAPGVALPLSRQCQSHLTLAAAQADAVARFEQELARQVGTTDALPTAMQREVKELIAAAHATLAVIRAEEQARMPLAGKRFASLFCGVGGFELALQAAGAECVFAAEIDPAARETYLANHGTPSGGFASDITQVDAASVPDHDILVGGFPCQSFSMAGNRRGFDDPANGGLFKEIVRIAVAKRPRVMILENAAGLVSHDEGRTARAVQKELVKLGYAVSRRVLNAADFGSPQQRQRLFIVATRVDVSESETLPFLFPKGDAPFATVADILQPVAKGAKRIATDKPCAEIETRARDTMRLGTVRGRDSQGYRVYSIKGRGITLCKAGGGIGGQTGLYLVGKQARTLTPREAARMQGFPDTFRLHSSPRKALEQLGNAVPVQPVLAIANQLFKH